MKEYVADEHFRRCSKLLRRRARIILLIEAIFIRGEHPFLIWDFKTEAKVGDKGRTTIPRKLRLLLGIRDGDVLVVRFLAAVYS